jgi:hypothetical protein
MQSQLFFAFEGFEAHRTHVRPFGIMRLLVPGQMVLPLQPCPAYITDKSALERVPHQVLLQKLLLRVRHVALGAAVERGAVQSSGQTDLAGLGPRLLLFLRFFLLLLLRRGALDLGSVDRGEVAHRVRPEAVRVRVQRIRPQTVHVQGVGVEQVQVGLGGLHQLLGTFFLDGLGGILEEVVEAQRQRRRREVRQVVRYGRARCR